MISPFQLANEIQFAWKAAAVITVAFVLAFMIVYFDSNEAECGEEA